MILIAIGANLSGLAGESPLETCGAAVKAIREIPELRFEALSTWYRTTPVPRSDQPDYINGVARFTRASDAAIDPAALLATLHAIEARFGRVRAERNAARSLDLDLIDVDGMVRHAPDPILPHPRAHLRAFVLLPLLDVAPFWVHPVSGQTARSLLDTVDRTGIRPLET